MFQGCYTALVTPFRDGAPDFAAFAAFIDWQIKAGAHGIVACGTTGESATLSEDEQLRLFETAIAAAAGRIRVLAGAGSPDTGKAIALCRAAKRIGADGALVVTPYYNRPSQAGLSAHYLALAESVEIPILLYNVPSRTGVDLSVDTAIALSAHPNIVGIKEATGDLGRVAALRAGCGPDFLLLSGDDSSALGFYAHGGDGVISVTSNVAPAEMSAMSRAALAGDFATARALNMRLAPLHKALFADSSPGPAKYALAKAGRMRPDLRLPLTPPGENARHALDRALETLALAAPA